MKKNVCPSLVNMKKKHLITPFLIFLHSVYFSSKVATIVAKPKNCFLITLFLYFKSPRHKWTLRFKLTFCLPDPFVLLTHLFSYIVNLLFPFVFLSHSVINLCITITTSLFMSHEFTPTKDCIPKFEFKFFCYGVKRINLSNGKKTFGSVWATPKKRFCLATIS